MKMSRLRLGLLAVVRRRAEWTRAGLWVRLHQQSLHGFGILSEIDRSSAVVDSISIRTQEGQLNRPKPGRPQQIRSKLHLLREAQRCPAHHPDLREVPGPRGVGGHPGQSQGLPVATQTGQKYDQIPPPCLGSTAGRSTSPPNPFLSCKNGRSPGNTACHLVDSVYPGQGLESGWTTKPTRDPYGGSYP
jgi:hypothetical protein